jgi:hypothetical protein
VSSHATRFKGIDAPLFHGPLCIPSILVDTTRVCEKDDMLFRVTLAVAAVRSAPLTDIQDVGPPVPC